MYLHSLRNFDVQGVIKLQPILDAILSFYWIVHGNGKYIFRYIQVTFPVSFIIILYVCILHIQYGIYMYIYKYWS